MSRVILVDNDGTITRELSTEILVLNVVDEINGEHSCTIQLLNIVLEKQQRLLVQEPYTTSGVHGWREYVVLGVADSHEGIGTFVNEYYCLSSFQYELSTNILHSQPGKVNPVSATVALTAALDGTRWQVGTVEPPSTGGASFYYRTSYEALSEIVKVWGGEVVPRVTFDADGVTGRYIDLLTHQGSESVVTTFEFGYDVQSMHRTLKDAPFVARIIPRGSAVESDSGGYGRKVDITSVNGGIEWIEDAEAASLLRYPDGDGGYIYPTAVVEYDGIDDPQKLLDKSTADLHLYTQPRATYDIDILELNSAGIITPFLKLGDEVFVRDTTFGVSGLRVSGRVTRIDADYLETKNNRVTVGWQQQTLADEMASINTSIDALRNWRELIEGALFADDTGALTATSDLTVNGALTADDATVGSLAATKNKGIITHNPNVEDGVAPSAAVWDATSLLLCDKNGTVLGYIRTPFFASGVQNVQIEATRTINGTAYYNGIRLGLTNTGEKVVEVSDQGAWRNAINAPFQFLGANPISGTSEDTTTYWHSVGIGYAHFGYNRLIDQPNQWGALLNLVSNNLVQQIFIATGTGKAYTRGGSVSAGWQSTWRQLGGGWTSMTTSTGTTSRTFTSLTTQGKNEVCITCKFDGKLLTAVVPVIALSTSTQEVWLTGGKSNGTTANGGALRAVCNLSLTSFAGVAANNGATDRTSAANWNVYVR